MMMIRHKMAMLLTMVGMMALAMDHDVNFPDFTIGDLQQRSAAVTLQTAATFNFSPTAADALFQVPNSVIDVIPTMVMEHISQERPLIVNRNLDLVDLFAGKARIARWATLAGLHAIAFDKLYGEHMDILTPVGLALIVLLVLRIKVGGLLAAGPQSSRKGTKRTKKNPTPNQTSQFWMEMRQTVLWPCFATWDLYSRGIGSSSNRNARCSSRHK